LEALMAKKKAATKKPSKGKHKKALAPITPTGIGVVSSIEFPRYLRKAFRKGVNDPDVRIKYKHVLGYDDQLNSLTAAINRLNSDQDIGVIVTVGGLAAYEAARVYAGNHASPKPFLSLTGATPPSQPNSFLGGVSLESFATNKDRRTHLTSKGHSVGNICLLYNDNSGMKAGELGEWPNTATLPVFIGNLQGKNDSSTYDKDFSTKIANTVTALVISADPFFQDTMDDLISAANKWVKNGASRYICYPMQEYQNADGDPGPEPGKSTLLGPDLRLAYKRLGMQVANALATGSNVGVWPMPQVTTTL